MDIDSDPPSSPPPLPTLSPPNQSLQEPTLPYMTITDTDNTTSSPTSAYQGLGEPSSDPLAIESQRGHVAFSNARTTSASDAEQSRKRAPTSPPISSIRTGQPPFATSRLTPRLAPRLANRGFEPPSSLTNIFGPTQAPLVQSSQPNQVKKTLLQARDLIVQASLQTKDREEQGRILDLLGVFREYIERGTIAKTSAILATQITSLEKATRQIQAKAKTTLATPSITPSSIPKALSAPVTSPAPQAPVAKPSFASVAKDNSQEWTVVDTKAKQRLAQEQAQKAKEKAKEKAKSKRLILIRQGPSSDFSAIRIRDSINNAFREKGVTSPVIALVTKARFSNNLVLTTTDSFSADFLIEKEPLWTHLYPNTIIQKDTSWYKVIAHGIPIAEFDTPNGMSQISEEIRTFNKGLIPINTPFWITSKEKRQDPLQRVGSVAIAFSTELEAKRAIQNRLYIAGISVRVEKYISVSPMLQCPNCQGYGHLPNRCRQKLACSLCAESHNTQIHACSLCKAKGTSCKHLVPKCANCQGPHKATDPCCEVRKALFNTTL